MNNGKHNLAGAVREARSELGLSQERLAEILNIDSSTIRGIEAGRGNPKFEKLYLWIAKFLKSIWRDLESFRIPAE